MNIKFKTKMNKKCNQQKSNKICVLERKWAKFQTRWKKMKEVVGEENKLLKKA